MKEPWYKEPVNMIIVYSILFMLNLLIFLWALIENNFSISWRDDEFPSLVGSTFLAISFIIGIARARTQMKN